MNIPSTLTEALLSVLPVFTDPTGRNFVRIVVGWLLCPGRRTITGIIPFADPEGDRQHDAYHRFFRAASWSVEGLFRLWTSVLVKNFAPEGHIWLQTDDTVFKKTGRKVQGAKFCRDAVRSTSSKTVYAWGLQMVPICLRVIPPWGGEPLSLPINLRLYRKNGPSLNALVEAMVHQLADWLPCREFFLVGDGAYASLAGRKLPRTQVLSRMRHDAALYELPPTRKPGVRGRPQKKGCRLDTPTAMAKRVRVWREVQTCERGHTRTRLVHTRKLLWYKVCKDTPVLLIICRDPEGKEKDDFFFSTDLNLPPEKVVSEYANRWAIEDTFRNLKQALGTEEPQCWQGEGPHKAIALGAFLYGYTWLTYILHGYATEAIRKSPWYTSKSTPSFNRQHGRGGRS